MKELIRQIFEELGFTTENLNGDLMFCSSKKEDFHEYYFCDFIAASSLQSYLDEKQRFSEVILPAFELQFKEVADVKKNASLILAVDFGEHLPTSVEVRKDILRLEENPFDLKKYIISYVQSGVPKVRAETALLDLRSIIFDDDKFTAFRGKADSKPEYFIAMQLQTKIPPFTLETEAVDMPSLKNKINQNLGRIRGREGSAWESIEAITDELEKFDLNRLKQALLGEQESVELAQLFNLLSHD